MHREAIQEWVEKPCKAQKNQRCSLCSRDECIMISSPHNASAILEMREHERMQLREIQLAHELESKNLEDDFRLYMQARALLFMVQQQGILAQESVELIVNALREAEKRYTELRERASHATKSTTCPLR